MPLTVDAFWLLKSAGVFTAYSKAELLDGELSGVPAQAEDEPENDASQPIKLRRQDYFLLCNSGTLETREKTELVDGRVYAMSPQYRRHGFIKDELAYRLRRALEDAQSTLHVATEQSVAIDLFSEPQPDIILTNDPAGDGPIPHASVAMPVEVSVSTVSFDLIDKAKVYARSGVGEYWVVDVDDRIIHQMWTPRDEHYRDRRTMSFGEHIGAMTLSGVTISTNDL